VLRPLDERASGSESARDVTLPPKVVHADWGTAPSKRWAAEARLFDDRYVASAPTLARDPVADALRAGEPAWIGFDFPIGLPLAYARKVGVTSFVELLPELGRGLWRDFFEPAATPQEISLHRPFYPRRPGETSQRQLLDALGVASIDQLRRGCERAHADRRAAQVLFWTLGANQVGRAAIAGWRDMLIPALPHIRLWPFHDDLHDAVVVCETYPSEFYAHLGLPRNKTVAARAAAARALLAAAAKLDVELDAHLRHEVERGFANDDAYDAFVGLLGMINVLTGRRAAAPPLDDETRLVEGWILGAAPLLEARFASRRSSRLRRRSRSTRPDP
jgi:hypothetical protein